jgi:hypothetical protein
LLSALLQERGESHQSACRALARRLGARVTFGLLLRTRVLMRVHSFESHREFQSFSAAHERLAERNVRHMRHPSNDELSNKKCASTKLHHG